MNKKFLKNLSFAFLANLIATVISLFTTLVVPKLFGEDLASYGYFQVYLLYISYAGLFMFGLCDGVFLREGGKRYGELDKKIHSSQFWIFTAFEIGLSVLASFIFLFFINAEYNFLVWTICLNIAITCITALLTFTLQTTNRIKEFSIITVIGRIIYLLFLFLIIIFGIKSYKVIVFSDLLGKVVSLLVACATCRDIIFHKPAKIKEGFTEIFKNISVGVKLMLANISGLLITGLIRFGIQFKWDIATYGKISFSLSASNMLMLFISAVAIVLFPTLKRMDKERLLPLYGKTRNTLMTALLGLLVFYYPLKLVLDAWLPQYSESIKYMAILFPLFVFSAKSTMLVQTYMQVFRLEKLIMRVNVTGVLVAAVTTFISVFWLHSLLLAMFSIVFNQIFRCVYAEMALARKINISVFKDIAAELILTVVFITSSWFIEGLLGTVIYLLFYAVYLIIKKDSLIYAYKKLRRKI